MSEILNTETIAELDEQDLGPQSWILHSDTLGNAFKESYLSFLVKLNAIYGTKQEIFDINQVISTLARKSYVDDKDTQIYSLINQLNKGAINVFPTDSPTRNSDTYNALSPGTYTNFGGIVVTQSEFDNNFVRIYRSVGGTWVKQLIPLGDIIYPVISDGVFPVGSNKKYKDIQSAINDAPNGSLILVDPGTYANFNLPSSKSNITLIGQYPARFNRATQSWSDGVLVENECSNNSSFSTIENIGFSIPTTTTNAGNNVGTSTTGGNVVYRNCDFSGNNAFNTDHNILLNDGNKALFIDCNFYNSIHGLAIKVSDVKVVRCKFYDHSGDLIIIRSDNGQTGFHPLVENISIISCEGENNDDLKVNSYGLLLDAQGTGVKIRNVKVIDTHMSNLNFGFITAGTSASNITEIVFTNVSTDNCTDGVKLLGCDNIKFFGITTKGSSANGIENFNATNVEVFGHVSIDDTTPYWGTLSGYYRADNNKVGIGSANPQSDFQVFAADGSGDTMAIYANGKGDGAGATLSFPMTLSNETQNSIIAQFKAKAFNGASVNSLELYIGDWANANNPGALKSRWLSNGVFDHLGQVQIRGGSPTSTSILVSTNSDGLAVWQEKNATGFEVKTNKIINFDTVTDTTYPSSKAVKDYVSAQITSQGLAAFKTGSGNGTATQITVAHGFSGITAGSVAMAQARNAAAANIQYVTVDATNIYIHYATAPASGTNNLSYSIYIKP